MMVFGLVNLWRFAARPLHTPYDLRKIVNSCKSFWFYFEGCDVTACRIIDDILSKAERISLPL